ncbi:uncharacterized protein Dsimw501_GD28071 [Drosophila simulans]|nr:uncharacterized protein Dsimw501_GD28071 [Drosophila simulans]
MFFNSMVPVPLDERIASFWTQMFSCLFCIHHAIGLSEMQTNQDRSAYTLLTV